MTGLEVSESISFPEAISLTQTLLDRLDDLAAGEVQATVTDLVKSANGARGFFVAYLSDERSYADHPTEGILAGLRTAPDLVAELLVKNLAMSTAMVLTHQRNDNEGLAESSARVSRRSANLIRQLHLPQVQVQLQQLSESLITQKGEYASFLQRWGYDAEQRQEIQQVVAQVLMARKFD
jgi:hypothetical protein